MTTLNQVNMELNAAGADAQLYKGNGYMYFEGQATETWKSTIVSGISSVKQMSVEQWVYTFFEMAANGN